MFGFFGSKSIRRSGAILVAGLLPAMSYGATSTIEVKVESKSFVSGSRTLRLEDGVPQTVRGLAKMRQSAIISILVIKIANIIPKWNKAAPEI